LDNGEKEHTFKSKKHLDIFAWYFKNNTIIEFVMGDNIDKLHAIIIIIPGVR